MKIKTLIIILLIILAGYGVYAYVTRPIAAPTTDIEGEVEHLSSTEEQSMAGQKVLRVVSLQSKAEFKLTEDLNGKPTVVVGTTNQIAGDIAIRAEAPSSMTIGEVKVDARTFKTDNANRDGAIGRLILKSEEKGNEYVTFKTTSVAGLPNMIETGKEFSYTITGDLTIRGITKKVIFDAKSALAADGSLTGNAQTTVAYADYGMTIPDFPFLANVDKTTELSVSFVAR
ncbi:MAG: YceI family protein [Bacteroidota bacterium]